MNDHVALKMLDVYKGNCLLTNLSDKQDDDASVLCHNLFPMPQSGRNVSISQKR